MATYLELKDLWDGRAQKDVFKKVQAAVAITADSIYREADGAQRDARMPFATEVHDSTGGVENMSDKIFWSLLAQNNANTVAQIEASTDAQVQTAVDDYVAQRYGAAA
jgi:Fic family protein